MLSLYLSQQQPICMKIFVLIRGKPANPLSGPSDRNHIVLPAHGFRALGH